MTRSMLRDALSALAAATLMSSAASGAAPAQGKSAKIYQAEVAVDAVRGVKPETPKFAKPTETATGENWRWFQDYGGGRFSQAAVAKGAFALSDEQ